MIIPFLIILHGWWSETSMRWLINQRILEGEVTQVQGRNLESWMDDVGLMDLKYKGPDYTWSNCWEDIHLIRERHDRALANSEWITHFPNTQVLHLPRTFSDHYCPVLVTCLQTSTFSKQFPFRCKESWLLHSLFLDLFKRAWGVNSKDFEKSRDFFTIQIKNWLKYHYFATLNKKKRILARLNGIQIALCKKASTFLESLEKDLLLEYSNILKLERIEWLKRLAVIGISLGIEIPSIFTLSLKLRLAEQI